MRKTFAAVFFVLALRGAAAAQDMPGWVVFTPADERVAMSANRLGNPGFEAGPADQADLWRAVGAGFAVDASGGREGGRALVLTSDSPAQVHGAVQVITLDQVEAVPIYLAGWSRAQGVSGAVDGDYSVYLDLRYTDDTPLYGQRLDFDVGDHDWQRLERFILPEKPVRSINVYCLLRNTHTGTAWFDDLVVAETNAEIAAFDTVPVAVGDRPPHLDAADVVRVASGDGLAIDLSRSGGAVAGVRLGSSDVADAARDFLGGFIVRDAAAAGPFVHVGGRLEAATDAAHAIVQRDDVDAVGLGFEASFRSVPDRIEIDATVTDLTESTDRAVTLYFALPVGAAGWTWHDDIRTERPVRGRVELAAFSAYGGIGATGRLSRYPWAAIGGDAGGLAIGVPLDQPRAMRLVHNPTTGQLFAAFDLGLAPETEAFPRSASVRIVLYPFDAAWGFRAAAQGYYDRFPEAFTRRIPPAREGLWVAFSDLAPIPDIADFGIAIHELGSLRQVAFDDSAGILSFRYIAEPWSHWLAIDDETVDPEDEDSVEDYLYRLEQRGNERAQATISSGFHDERGRLRYRSTDAPWCRGTAGCAVFTVNPDPDIHDPFYPMNKAFLEWNDAARETYLLMGLDGEYVDSYLGQAMELDLRRSHFAALDTPLTFATRDRRVGIPEVFATTEFARWLTDEVHDDLGKWTMANGILLDLPWGADLFDFLGTETDWLRSGQFTPETDARLSYRRTLAYRKPDGMLMNTDFDAFGADLVERYMQISLFYALYPSLFSHNASEDRYWDDPALYERDRSLFARYVPLVRRLSAAGWEPVTHARSEDPAVFVERYGRWPDLYLAVRAAATDAARAVTLDVDTHALGFPCLPLATRSLVGGRPVTLTCVDAAHGTITLDLPSGATDVVQLSGVPTYLPITAR